MQWISKRDNKVRATHRSADGQTRRIGDDFQVGSWFLRFPADPKDLPASWSEVAGCRCSLGFRKPSKSTKDTLRLLDRSTDAGEASAAAQKLLRVVAASVPGDDDGTPPPTPVTLSEPLAGYRLLDGAIEAVPGQWLTGVAGLTLALAAPMVAAAGAQLLAVAIPAGAKVVVSGGTVILEGGSLEVVGVTGQSIETRAVE
jgi:hypothetical protein